MTEGDKYDWYWSNYRISMDWTKKHEIKYWKSQALSLKAENNMLIQTIHDLQAAMHPPEWSEGSEGTSPKKKCRSKGGKRRRKKRNIANKTTQSDVSELDVEVTPELVEFLKISLKHKKEYLKEKEALEDAACVFQRPQETLELRQKEMEQLYGEDSAKILGMETAMILGFERYLDHESPKYWPNLPLNLS